MSTYQDIYSYIHYSLAQDLNKYQTGNMGELVKGNFTLSQEKIKSITLDSILSEVSPDNRDKAELLYYSSAFVAANDSHPFSLDDASNCISCLNFIKQHTNELNLEHSIDNLIFSITDSVGEAQTIEVLTSWILRLREIVSQIGPHNIEPDEQWIKIRITTLLWDLLKEKNKDTILKGLRYLAKLKKNNLCFDNLESFFVDAACDWIEETNDFHGIKQYLNEEVKFDEEGAKIMLGIIKEIDIQEEEEYKARVDALLLKYGFIPAEIDENLQGFARTQAISSLPSSNQIEQITSRENIELIGEAIYVYSRGLMTTSIYEGKLKLPGNKSVNIAIKSISHPNKEELKNSEEEAQFLKSLSGKHSSFPLFYGDFYDMVDQKHRYNLVMELCRRETLFDDILERKRTQRAYTDAEYLKIFNTLIDCIVFLHSKKIYHRDIKPQNILFTKEGDAKVVDFNVAKSMDMPTVGVTSTEESITGTVNYMSPEIREAYNNRAQKGANKVKTKLSKSDVYSLGLILLEMRTLGDINDINLKTDQARAKLADMLNMVRPIGEVNLRAILENMLKEDYNERINSKSLLGFMMVGATEAIN